MTIVIADISEQNTVPQAAIADFFALLKPRVMSLVIFTSIIGLIVTPGHIHPVLAFTAIFCISIGAGASGCLNMWYDRDIDAVMSRTRLRPIPRGAVSPDDALAFGMILSCFSVGLMGLAVNVFAAALLAFTIFFYAVVYTMWLKRTTPQNIVIGGLAGALPPVIAWVSVTGSLAIEPIIMCLLIFVWTPPHFWALSLVKSDDYKIAGLPMMVIVAGEYATRRYIFIYSLLLLGVSLLPDYFAFANGFYMLGVALLDIIFLALAGKLLYRNDKKTAMLLFYFSIFYLFAVFLLLGFCTI